MTVVRLSIRLQVMHVMSASCFHHVQAAQAAAAAVKPGAKQGAPAQPDDELLDPNQYYERRVKAVKSAREAGLEPYPHKFATTIQVPEYIEKYGSVPVGQHDESVTERIAGNINPSFQRLQ